MSDWLLKTIDGIFFFFKTVLFEKVSDIQDVYPTELILKIPFGTLVSRAGLTMIHKYTLTI